MSLTPTHTPSTGEADLLMVQQVGSSFCCSLKRLFMSPVIYLFRISTQKNIRHFPATEICRACIYRWCQQVVLERIKKCRSFVIQHTRNKPANGIHHYCSCELSTTQHIITNRNFQRHEMLSYALVNSFIVSANKQQILF